MDAAVAASHSNLLIGLPITFAPPIWQQCLLLRLGHECLEVWQWTCRIFCIYSMLVTGEIDIILNPQAVDIDEVLVDLPLRVGTLILFLQVGRRILASEANGHVVCEGQRGACVLGRPCLLTRDFVR